MREDVLVALVEAGLIVEAGAACADAGVEGVAVAVSGCTWGGGDTGWWEDGIGLVVVAGDGAAED